MKIAIVFALLIAALMGGRAQAADAKPAARANPFACLGEGESLYRGNSTAEVEAEIKKRLDNPPGADEDRLDLARFHCVTAELMRRVGDMRAAEQYEQAIAAAPDEPGFELWYGYYLRNVRGPRHPLDEQAELHLHRGLDKMRALRAAGATLDFDDITQSWLQRNLLNVYQEDGLPLLGAKAFPYAENGAGSVGAALTVMLRGSHDTNEFGIIDDARRFAAEAAFASSAQRLNRPLDGDELRGIVRTPTRTDLFARLRLHVPVLGTVDASYDRLRAPQSQISAYTAPNTFGDVAVDSYAVEWHRTLDLYPLFDVMLDFGYRRVERTGVVEWYPELKEGINMFEAHPVLSRFIGPDKLTLGMNYVYMQIPLVPGGPIADRVRARAIRAFYFDYAIYRQLLLPDLSTWEVKRMPTRGLHIYGGYAMDDEAFGVRLVYRRDTYGGISLRGIGGFDFTLQGTLLGSDTTEDRRAVNNQIERIIDGPQTIRQLRPTFILLYRIVDDEAIPDVPKTPLAGLNLVLPVRADKASEGTNKFDNLRAGAELWGKFISTGLRGTTFLVTAGYEVQWFHQLAKTVHMGHLELRMGWGTL
jgi:hypothetical protein